MLKPKKSLGQNFLVDQGVVRDLVEATEPGRSDLVIEIGAGTGIVTKELAKRVGKVLAVEFDRDLIPTLKLNLAGLENVKIINADILKLDLSELINDQWKMENHKIIGSIPYQITSPLIHKLLTINNQQLTIIVLLIQKEVAEKIIARAPKATYLSNFVQAFAEVEVVKNVPKTAFKPQPDVDGAIIKMTPSFRTCFGIQILNRVQDDKKKMKPREWGRFLHRGFSYPRKMLRNIFPEEILKEAGIDPKSRAQELALQNWFKLFQVLRSAKL